MTAVAKLDGAVAPTGAVPPRNTPSSPRDPAQPAPSAVEDTLNVSPFARLAWSLSAAGIDPAGFFDLEDGVFNLSRRDGGRLLRLLEAAETESGKAALKQLAELLQQGVIGWEYREDVRTRKPYKVFLSVGLGADSWYGLRPWRSREFPFRAQAVKAP